MNKGLQYLTMMALLSVQDAKSAILSQFKPVSTEIVSINNAIGFTMAAEVTAPFDLPLFDNSSVDGFAVRAEDIRSFFDGQGCTLPVVADIPAGADSSVQLQHGQAARIMTGAPIPSGADAVVMVENTDADRAPAGSPLPKQVVIKKLINNGDNIRLCGADLHMGDVLLQTGHTLRPQDIGMLAMIGQKNVLVYRQPKVAIFSSGDELATPGMHLRPGQIYDANSPMLEAMVDGLNCQVIPLGIAKDNRNDVERVFELALGNEPDVIISSAGVGTGVYDYIKEVVGAEGKLDFWKVNMRPGKPLAFGNYRGVPFFGLPGNPVSSYVSFQVFARPALCLLAGKGDVTMKKIRVTLGESVISDGRESYLRCVVTYESGRPVARMAGHQGSGNLFSTVLANTLLIIPAGVVECAEGSEWDAWMLDS